MIDPKGLQQALAGGRRLLIFLHDNPDPDAVAAGWLLTYIAADVGLAAEMVHGGSLGRAENRAMVRHLDIPLSPFQDRGTQPHPSDRFALVDTQPHAGNNAFPGEWDAHVVIDHHSSRPDLKARFVDVRADGGCTTTLLLGYHQAFGLDLSPGLATAAYYAIISETQDLHREATKADRDACLRLLPLLQLSTLGKIRHPSRERDYYRTIARAMRHVMVGRNTCICHVGSVVTPETVAELADFLVAMRHVSWCLVTGLLRDQMVLSIRTTHEDGHADAVMKHLVQGDGTGGGHDMMAGGAMPCGDQQHYRELAARTSDRLLESLARRTSEHLHPLLDEDSGNANAGSNEGK